LRDRLAGMVGSLGDRLGAAGDALAKRIMPNSVAKDAEAESRYADIVQKRHKTASKETATDLVRRRRRLFDLDGEGGQRQ